MEIPDARIERLVVRFKTHMRQAADFGRAGSGRIGRQMLAEARFMEEIAIGLLGPDVWQELLDAPGRDASD